MNKLRGFPPVAASDARVLVLGSMPSLASLAAGEYYAHPRNAFWPIMGELLGFDSKAPYAVRTRALSKARIALWDVIVTCVREGSLDANIAQAVPNDIHGFLRRHPGIRTVFFNGTAAATLFRRLVEPGLERPLDCHRLPSTSPAHAARSFAKKLAAWRAVTAATTSSTIDRAT